MNFASIKELYDRVYPALRSKVKELNKNNISYIKEEDIWNCLIELKWKNKKGLVLSEIVDDILNTDNIIIDNYIKEKIKNEKRIANLNDNII